MIIILFAILLLQICFSKDIYKESYLKERQSLMEKDFESMFGNDLTLTKKEKEANEILMFHKNEEFSAGFKNPHEFIPSRSFFQTKPHMEKSQVFQFIRKMPKGAVLHLHDTSMGNVDWIVSNLTYWDDLYMCNSSRKLTYFRFFNTPDSTCDWKLVKDERYNYSSVQDFDNYLHSILSLYTPFPEIRYPSINSVWKAFEYVFRSVSGILTYRKAYEAYFSQTLLDFLNDGVYYMEIRGTIDPLYEKDGRIYSAEEIVGIYKSVADKFTSEHEDFFGARFIYAPYRLANVSTVWDYIDLAIRLRNLYPTYVAGFDMVGQEDKGRPLIDFIEPLLNLSSQDPPMPVFYHAGETDWEGLSSDENIFDALLLNATRIGHGYAISKHPALIEKAIQNGIAIEVCPISNQVLMLVDDLRNHPFASLVAKSFPIVVGSDDPAMWGALPLSHDFYEAFMGLGGAKSDLRFIKKLAINSIRYSSLEPEHKIALAIFWNSKWKKFINSFEEHKNSTNFKNLKLILTNKIRVKNIHK